MSSKQVTKLARILVLECSPNGSVSRGICEVENGNLSSVVERITIERNADGQVQDSGTGKGENV